VNDADLEMAELEAAAAHEARLRKRGRCPHGWRHAPDNGPVTCLDCGATFPDIEAAEEARREVLDG
jgi:hypothetical protein